MNASTVRSLLLPHVVLMAAASLPLLSTPGVQPSLSGTYKIAVCKRQPCKPEDTTNVVVSGILVLSDSNYSLAAFPDSVRFALQGGDVLTRRNGCSATAARTSAPGTYAGIGGMELVTWEREGPNKTTLALHKEGGIEYQLQLTFANDRFSGVGKSIRSAGVAPEYSNDIVVGLKSGASDFRPCADSALAWQRKVRK